jgi:hypothetical protein
MAAREMKKDCTSIYNSYSRCGRSKTDGTVLHSDLGMIGHGSLVDYIHYMDHSSEDLQGGLTREKHHPNC